MKLSKALRVKNQLVLQINKTRSIINKYNSYNIENIPKWNVVEHYKKLLDLKNKLIELKTKVSVANRPILEVIHTMEETKATISFLREIPITAGFKTSSYSDKKEEYRCSISEIEICDKLKVLQDTIETMQDTLAEHNAKTEITFSL